MTDVTKILLNWSNEPQAERGEVVAALYDELRDNAARHLHKEGGRGDLQPTMLVNESYMRLVNINRIDLQGRTHFFGLAGKIMREILVDEARRMRAKKRDIALQTQFEDDIADENLPVQDILELDELLNGLEDIDPVYARLFEARAFAGMTIEESAQSLDMSVSSVKRKWKIVIAWLKEHHGVTDN
ncbi:MAG: ECF-type sigma factor [Pseudomonadaceae bacterium]|nr:ECF-type sigma factor [Pseudomonadaceae bacterium]